MNNFAVMRRDKPCGMTATPLPLGLTNEGGMPMDFWKEVAEWLLDSYDDCDIDLYSPDIEREVLHYLSLNSDARERFDLSFDDEPLTDVVFATQEPF